MRLLLLIHLLLGLDVLLTVQIQHVLIFIFQHFDSFCLLGISPLQVLHIRVLQLQEASALRARESVEATALGVDALVRSYDRMMKQWRW